jgi:hypothetical protein
LGIKCTPWYWPYGVEKLPYGTIRLLAMRFQAGSAVSATAAAASVAKRSAATDAPFI